MKTKLILTGIFIPILMLLTIMSACAQGTTVNEFTTRNQCVDVFNSSTFTLRVDSFDIIRPPANGTLTGSVYCPNTGYIGVDTIRIMACALDSIDSTYQCNDIQFQVRVECAFTVNLDLDSFAICPGGNRSFTAHPIGGNAPYTYRWPNGSTDSTQCEQGPSSPACVIVTDTIGCQGFACSTPVQSCNLQATILQVHVCAGPLPDLQASVIGGTAYIHYLWSTGDTSVTLCNIPQGTYSVTATDMAGCTATQSYTINASQSCSYYFAVDSTSNSVFFSPNTDPTLTATSFWWSFGDNTVDTAQAPTHVYATTGSYNAYMVVQYSNGDTCGYWQTINVHDSSLPCVVNVALVADTFVCFGGGRSFFASPSGGVAPYTYAWSDSTNGNVGCLGTAQTICVTVTDANGCSATACGGASPCQLSAIIIADSLGICANGIPVTVSVVGGSGTYYYRWTDGSASSSICLLTSVSYSVTVTDSLTGCTTIANINGNNSCQANFDYFINNDSVYFVDRSVYHTASWAWDFGDGSTSTLQHPSHQYTTQGTYTACLTTTDSIGCSSNYCSQVNTLSVQDLSVTLYHQTTTMPGFPIYAYLHYYNAGTVLVTGTVQYRYPVGSTVTSTYPVPVAHDVANRLLTFSFVNIVPGNSQYISVNLATNSNLAIGTLAEDTAWINPTIGDATPNDNIAFINDTVIGSYDPNDKAVSPKGEGDEGRVPMNTSDLSYRIRFQNTGTAPAQRVEIRDTLNSNLDMTTVQVVGASHDYVVQLIGNVLVVTFHNINLPDSNANYEASQGYILVHAKVKPSLTSGTHITNTAHIYFDFNAPVVTNTVTTTIWDKTTGISHLERFDFAVVPNPAHDQITLKGYFDNGVTYELSNQLGQVLTKGTLRNNSTIDVSQLSAGIYFVKVVSGEKVGIQRLSVSK